ncbi:cadherin-related family member 2 isoform X2 [Rhineura floridana]|uniref:cadherin-related family member 2 isoform X2 n=1 Tax=Rhineura floridana TaxID=261503 RepID=UPI002AC88C62|nr:cadherin-related family member 2 isoform X2 [Rhineura floridana]
MIDQLIYSRSQSLNGLSHLLPATESSHFLRIPHDTRSFFPSRMLWLSWTILSIFLAVEAWVFQLVAVDAEGDTLTYSLEGVYAYYFSVNSESGNVTLEQTVDYEQRKVIILDAGVTDGKSVKIYKKITIIIEDRNDNKPIFQKEPYFTDVLENTRIGSPIYTVLAMDMDTGNAGRVSYTIEEVNPNDAENHWLFYILYNGTVVLNGSLSYNNKSTFYRIKILATDHGGQLNGKLVYQNNTAYLSVTVVDVADLDPIFLGAPYTSSVPENCTLGTSVVKVLAIDQDSNVNDIIYYNITSATSLFTIDTITGVITVSGPLDREGVPGEEVQLQVVAQEKNLNVYQEVAQVITTVTIQVTDINDNKPQFYMCSTYPTCNITDPQGNFFGDIEEHASARTPVAGLNIVAYDSDKGSNGTFQLSLQGPDSFAFSVLPMKIVNEGTVQVLVSNSSLVDYEKTPHMTVQIVANDTGRATDCCSFATVTITLTDINDHRPEFNQSEYKLYVLEESPPGTIVSSNITATDPDSGKYGEITYYLLPQSIQSTFTVNATSGVVLVVNGTNLDWGVRPVYYATLQAVDGGGLSGSTQLEITVVDINNKPPVVTGSYNVFVTEGENSTVHIQATDQDDPETNNSRLLFEIVPGDFSSYFTIDPVTGVLSSKSPLDREAIPVELKGKMEVTVLVHDLGIPQLNATVNVTFIVEDINDNAPRFNSSFYDFFVQEGFQGSFVGIVEATDADQTVMNNRISFHIESSAGSNNFLIRSKYLGPGWYQGNLTLDPDVHLDYDQMQQKFFNLTVQAENSDFGGTMDVATAVVKVNVLDVNDESPTIVPSPPHDINVFENSTLHELVAMLNATDMDTNHSLVFQELGVACFKDSDITGNVCQKWFHLEPNGSLFVNSSELNYEVCDLVKLTLRVKDEFTEKGYPYSTNETLRILIVDVNDNPPVFLQSTNTFVIIPEISPMDLQVAVVKATDDDTGANGVITFAISRVLFIPDTGPHQTLENLFKVVTTADKNVYTGSIQVASNLDSSLKGRYQVMVEAKDHGVPLLNSSVSLDIYTVDQSYRVRLVFTSSLQTVQAKSDEIKASLSTATQTTVYIANIKLIEGSETSRSDRAMSKTAMEAYFVYSNGTALMAGQVRVLIQRNPEEMSRLINLGLSIIGPVEVTESNKVLELLGIIAGLAGAVVLILIVMILIITGMRKSYVRKLKALQALKVASKFSPAEVKQGPAIPGTNKYNTEGANPVLGLSLYPSLDLEENTSFEVASLNSLDENMVDAPENAPVAPAPKHKADARYQANGWKEPLKAALESHNKDKPEQLGHLKNKSLTFENPSLDTTDL